MQKGKPPQSSPGHWSATKRYCGLFKFKTFRYMLKYSNYFAENAMGNHKNFIITTFRS